MNDYKPNPIDTSDVLISDDIKKIIEFLAKNIHENWAYERMRLGWTFNSTLNEKNKTHPRLIPYEQLSEEEKNIDRITVIETVKLLQKIGYKIQNEKIKDY